MKSSACHEWPYKIIPGFHGHSESLMPLGSDHINVDALIVEPTDPLVTTI